MYHTDSRKARDGLLRGSHLDHVEKMHADGSGELIGEELVENPRKERHRIGTSCAAFPQHYASPRVKCTSK